MHVRLDNRTQTTGVILCEQVKSLDYAAKNAVFVEQVPEDILFDLLERIRLSLT